MLEARAYGQDGRPRPIPAEHISEAIADGDLVWVDLVEETEDDFTCLQDEFGLHPLALEDARKHGQRPKIDQYDDHAFVVAYSHTLAEVDIFIGPSWLITVRDSGQDGQRWGLRTAQARFDRTSAGQCDVGFLLYTILDELVDGYFIRTDENEDRIEVLEERIFTDEDIDERTVQHELFGVRRDLLEMRRRVAPLREVIASLLRQEVKWVSGPALVHLQDVYDHVLRALDLIDGQRELIGNVVDAHLALMSNRMNQVMKSMTSWGAILLGSTLIAGIYGMNFEHMPELGWKYGYPLALLMMAVLTVTGYRFFKHRDWL